MTSGDDLRGGGAEGRSLRFAGADADIGERLDLLVARRAELSRTQAATLIANGHVTVSGRREKASYRVEAGDDIAVVIPTPPGREIVPEQIPLDIVYEDEHLLVVDKAAGMVVHPAPGNWTGTLVNALIGRGEPLAEGGGEERAGLVHRLDKDTSGLLVVAKTLEAQTSLVRQLQARTVSRRYLAIVLGAAPESDVVEAAIGRHPTQRTRMAPVATGKPAVTHYRALRRGDGWTLLECRLETGRTHQIRVHMDAIGHPLLGDPVYGPRRPPASLAARVDGFHRQALHAWKLALVHPATQETLGWEAPPPADFQALLERLEAP